MLWMILHGGIAIEITYKLTFEQNEFCIAIIGWQIMKENCQKQSLKELRDRTHVAITENVIEEKKIIIWN